MCISNIISVDHTIEWFCGDGLPQVCFYSAVIQHCDQTQLEKEKASFIWQVTVDHHRKPRQELKAGTWKQKPKLRPRKNAVYWLIYCFSSASFSIQYRDGSSHSGIGPSSSIGSNCAPQRCPQTNLMGAVPPLKSPLPGYVTVTIKLTRMLPETGLQEEWVLVGDCLEVIRYQGDWVRGHWTDLWWTYWCPMAKGPRAPRPRQ